MYTGLGIFPRIMIILLNDLCLNENFNILSVLCWSDVLIYEGRCSQGFSTLANINMWRAAVISAP